VAIVGAHMLLYTPEAERLRAVLRDGLGWDAVEAHDPPDGWLIFKLPPAELGVHPSDGATRHELGLMCDDLEATVADLRAKDVEIRGQPSEELWGVWTTIVLPGGVELLLYEPKHASPLDL
jgi:hypothetical protein